MPDVVDSLDAPPSADAVRSYRRQAADAGTAVRVEFPGPEGPHTLVVSPRGTCTVLTDTVSGTPLPPSASEDAVAEALADLAS